MVYCLSDYQRFKSLAFEKTPRINLSYKLVPIREYKNGTLLLVNGFFFVSKRSNQSIVFIVNVDFFYPHESLFKAIALFICNLSFVYTSFHKL